MMTTFFMICAVIGGAIVLAQLALSLFAFGAGHSIHVHHHAAGHAHAPRGPAKTFKLHLKSAPKSANTSNAHHADSSIFFWLQCMFNFQGLVAGATVLGLAGLSATAAHLSPLLALLIAAGAAIVMMALVAACFSFMTNMEHDGTVQIDQAVGIVGTVYLSIPPKNEGQGKITLTLQHRTMEFPAVTLHDEPLPAGRQALVVAVQKSSVMEVVSADKFLNDTHATT
jgi:hypothetical protein